MIEAMIHSNFVSPHYIEELGEEGLTLHEIAQSLGIQFKHAKEALEKNLSDYSAVEISTQQEIQEVTGFTYARKVNSYALTTENSRVLTCRPRVRMDGSLLRLAQGLAASMLGSREGKVGTI